MYAYIVSWVMYDIIISVYVILDITMQKNNTWLHHDNKQWEIVFLYYMQYVCIVVFCKIVVYMNYV